MFRIFRIGEKLTSLLMFDQEGISGRIGFSLDACQLNALIDRSVYMWGIDGWKDVVLRWSGFAGRRAPRGGSSTVSGRYNELKSRTENDRHPVESVVPEPIAARKEGALDPRPW
jgi:hypothetical protein